MYKKKSNFNFWTTLFSKTCPIFDELVLFRTHYLWNSTTELILTLRLFLEVHITGHLSHLKSLVFSLCERACRFDFWQSTFCWWDFSPFSPRNDFWHREQLKWVAANGCAAIMCSLRAFFVSNKAPHFSQDILFSSLSE